MDGDPSVEPALDTLSLYLPLPYRIALLVVLGVWAWGANLHILHHLRIDAPHLLHASLPHRPRARSSTSSRSSTGGADDDLPAHRTTYRLAALLTAPLAPSLVLFWLATRGDPARVRSAPWAALPGLHLALLAAALLLPLPARRFGTAAAGRAAFRAGLARVALGNIAPSSSAPGTPANGAAAAAVAAAAHPDGVAVGGGATLGTRFADVLLADALTSYAKVLGDAFAALCALLLLLVARGSGRNALAPDRACGGGLLVPLVLAAPSAMRLRQCLVERGRALARRRRFLVEEGEQPVAWKGDGSWEALAAAAEARTHLANALKYASAFPVILFSALLRGRDAAASPGGGGAALFRLWLLFVFINSVYSFYWDVAKDWSLSLLSSPRQHRRAAPDHPFGLRRHRYLPAKELYYFAVALDLLLRFTWSLKLSPHLDHFHDMEGGIFIVELLELFRRWIWVFLRVEAEWSTTIPPGWLTG